MKWFKHDSDASNDAKLKKLRLKYGAQGYGIYWYCLELIARNVEKHNLTFELEHDAELIADDFKLSPEIVQHIMTYMVELGLFENTDGIITCLKMATRTDEYTQQIIRDNNKLQNSRETPESLPRMSEVIEEKRTEEKRKTPLPKDFCISDRVLEWANKEGYTNLNRHFDNFVSMCEAKGYKYVNWDSAFMNAIRNNWANVNPLKRGQVAL